MIALQLALLILWNTRTCDRTATSIVAAVLALIVGLVLIPLSHTEHTRSVRPSTLICVYLFASIAFDVVQTRTLFISGSVLSIPVTLCCSIATKMAVLYLEASEKRAYLRVPYNSYPPEAVASTFNRTFLWWLNRIFFTGFRKLMTLDDLRSTTSELRSKAPAKRLRKSWRFQCRDRAQVSPPSRWMLPLASFSCFRSEIISVVPARLFLIGFNYAQPFLFARAIELLAGPVDQRTEDFGYGLIAATAIIYIGIAVSLAHRNKIFELTSCQLSTVRYQQSMFKTLTMFRGAMVSLVFDHSVALSDHMNAENAAVSHMSTGTSAADRVSYGADRDRRY